MPANATPLSVIRREDLLHLAFDFVNLELNSSDPKSPRLVRVEATRPAYLVVYLAPQHIQEQAFFEAEPQKDKFKVEDPLNNPDPVPPIEEIPPPAPVAALISGDSRLVFRLPDDLMELPYTLAALLDWSAYDLNVHPRALPRDPTPEQLAQVRGLGTPLSSPEATHTALELPYRLILSPHEKTGWIHAFEPVTRAGRTELWHTRFAVRLEDGTLEEAAHVQRTVRAIWATGFDPNNLPAVSENDDFRASLSPRDRHMLVRQTSDFDIVETPGDTPDTTVYYDPEVVEVNRLMLSSLGTWLNVRGSWDIPEDLGIEQKLDLEEWRHIAAQGRDQYVRVVYAGFLYPFGHRASLVKVTERKFQSFNADGQESVNNFAAYLRQRMYIVVRQPVKQYAEAQFAHNGREMPLKDELRITTLVTPNIDLPDYLPKDATNPAELSGAFWIRVGGDDFKFHFVARDVEGQTSEFTAALIFVRLSDVNESTMKTIRAAYAADNERRRCLVPNQNVAYAQRNPNKPGNAVLKTAAFLFDTQELLQPGFSLADFTPLLHRAEVHIPSVEQLVGPKPAQTIALFEDYLEKGLELADNASTIFAQLTSLSPLTIATEKAGGLTTPNLDIGGLSQHLGPLAGELETLKELASGNFNPAAFFTREDAQLLGGVKLSDIVEAIFDDAQFPKMLSEQEPPLPALPDWITTTLTWNPKVKSAAVFVANENAAGDTDLKIEARIEQKLNLAAPTGPSFTIEGKLTHFKINFLEVIEIEFNSLSFKSQENGKLDVSADMVPGGIRFLGPLEFLTELQKFIPADGFIDPPFLDISPTGATVGFTQALPPLAVGVFSLQNVSVGARLNLPFVDGAARLRFNFAERHETFVLSVGIFGGGGFFTLALGLDGLEQIEAALEFGGTASLNLGVASGSVYIMAGIYFKYEDPDKVQLSGYLRCGGRLSVLGLITVSVEFYLEFSYIKQNDAPKVTGRATLTVKVEVLFFSKTVKLTVERTFSGTANDPTFADMLDASDWQAYGLAFA